MVVLEQFQKNLFHMLRSLARVSWDTGVPLDEKGCFLRIFQLKLQIKQSVN